MSAYTAAVTADNPTHYWRMCDPPGSSLLHDIGSNPVHAQSVTTNAGAGSGCGYSGPVSDGGSVNLSLDNFYANTGGKAFNFSSPLTFELWLWVWQNLNLAVYEMFETSGRGIRLFRDGNNWAWFWNGNTLLSNHNYTIQAWHHLVGTYDGANSHLYVDGALQISGADTAGAAENSGVQWGANPPGNVHSGAFFAEAAIYATALSAGRIAAHFAAADNTAQAPVYGAAGGLTGLQAGGGGGLPADYNSILQQILASVRQFY